MGSWMRSIEQDTSEKFAPLLNGTYLRSAAVWIAFQSVFFPFLCCLFSVVTFVFLPFFSLSGAYIYLEASQRLVGDRARLLTRWLATGGPRCLQFWYHMFGRHVGSLNVLIKTNTSESLIWSQTGGQEDKWILGQVPIHQSKAFKVSAISLSLGK